MSETASLSGVSPLGTISESDMLLKISTTQTLKTENGRSVIKEVMVFVEYEWFGGKPTVCKEDGISVNWDSGLFGFKPDSFYSNDYKKFLVEEHGSYKISNWILSDSQINPTELNQGGLGYIAYLNRGNPPAGTKELYGARGWARMFLLPLGKIYAGDSRNTLINVQYAHNKNIFPWVKVGFSCVGASVTIDLGSGSRDSVAKAANVKYST